MRRVLIAALALLLPLAGWSSNVYKYRDAAGVWHYSDQRPGGSQAVQQLDLSAKPLPTTAAVAATRTATPRQVVIERRGSADAPEFYAVNRHFSPVEVRFWLTESANLVQQRNDAVNVVVPPMGERRVLALTPQDAEAPTRYRYQFRWQLGDPAARHAEDAVYLPPVPLNRNYRISQAFGGAFSHNSPGSRHAIDIPLPEGTPVMAARGGRVISTRMESQEGGNSPSFRPKANTIYIQHDDGTYAVYAHLRYRSALVAAGDRVAAGQIIAQSGNTGYSTAPHLHFAVLRNAGLRWESEPFAVALAGEPVSPKAGLAFNVDPATGPTVATAEVEPAFGQPTNSGH